MVRAGNDHEFGSRSGAGQGSVVPLPSAPDSGLFYFFAPGNIQRITGASTTA